MKPRPGVTISNLEALPCPLCGEALERGQGRQGLVWFCGSCLAGAVTLPILRRFAPRPVVNQLWQAALHGGRTSTLICPACARPFTEVRSAVFPSISACVRCYWVWLGSDVLSSLATITTPAAPALIAPASRRQRQL